MSKKKYLVNEQLNEENENAPLFARTSVSSRNRNENSNNGYYQSGKPKTRRSQSILNKERQHISHLLKDPNVAAYIEQNSIIQQQIRDQNSIIQQRQQNLSQRREQMERNIAQINQTQEARDKYYVGLLRSTRGTPSRASIPVEALHKIKQFYPYPNALVNQLRREGLSNIEAIQRNIATRENAKRQLTNPIRKNKVQKVQRYLSKLKKIYPAVSRKLSLPRSSTNTPYTHLKRSFNHNEKMAAAAATRRNSRLRNAEARKVLELNNGTAVGANHPNYKRMTAPRLAAAAGRHNGSAAAGGNNWEAFANSSGNNNGSAGRHNGSAGRHNGSAGRHNGSAAAGGNNWEAFANSSGNNNGENGWSYLAQSSSKPAGKLSPKK